MSNNRSLDDSRSLAWPAELDQCVEAFQAALARGQRPSLEDFLPAGPATVVLVELIHSELVFRLKQGEPARVEEYLARYPQLAGDPAVVDLVIAEYTIRHQREGTLNWDSYLERFPDYRDTLAVRLPHVGESRSQTGDTTLPSSTASGPGGAVDLPCVPGYEILSELGRGAMGVVYKARQIALNRLVALKMLHTTWRTDAAQRARFRVEVETIALLQHPNIVQVYDVGAHEGRPFFIMEFLDGGSLADSCRGRPQPANAAAELVETLARAVFAVHAKGIVHRDLKPSNIVRTADGRPKITDFGLARHEASGLTVTGDVLGTPSYMAPEQAAGKAREVGPAADVYALGAILYEQLTGRPPFRGVSMMDVVRQVQDSDPVAPRRMEARTPRDLETICLKCLRKEPGRRYASAGELADDLRCSRNGEPIQARPPAWPERLARWVRRHPAAAVLLAAVALLALTVPLALLGHTLQLREAFDRAQRESDKARDAQAVAQVQEAEARASRYASDLLLASNLFKAGNVFHLPGLLEPHRPAEGATDDPRGFEWGYFQRHGRTAQPALAAHDGPLHLLAYAPEGQALITAGGEPERQTVRVWDLPTTRSRFRRSTRGLFPAHQYTRTAYAPHGGLLAGTTDPDTVTLWDFAEGQTKLRLRHSHEIKNIALSPKGRWLAVSAADRITLWDCATGRPHKTLTTRSEAQLTFSPDGDTLVAAVSHPLFQGIRWWDVASGVLRQQSRFAPGASSVSFSPRGTFLLVIDASRRGAVWDASQRIPLHWSPQIEGACSLAVSPDERTLAAGDDAGTIRLWDIPTGRLRGHYHWQPAAIVQLAFSPDNRTLAAATAEGQVHQLDPNIHDVPDGLRIVRMRGVSPAWSPDGETVAVAGEAGAVYLIDRRTAEMRTVLRCPFQNVRCLAFAPDGRTLATACEKEPFVRLWDVTAGRQRAVTAPQAAEVAALAFSPDGRRLATVDQKTIRFWDPVTGRTQGTLESDQPIQDLLFTPDGHALLTAGPSIQVWDVGDSTAPAKPVSTVRAPSAVTRLAVTRDGRRVAAGAGDGTVRLWRLSADRKLTPEEASFPWTHRGEAVTDLGFGADDKILLVGVSGKVFLCAMPAGQYKDTLSGAVRKGALSPDGRMLAAIGEDGVVRLWDVTAWRMRPPARQALSRVSSLIFSADGCTLITASRVPGFSIRNRKFLVEETASLRSTAESIRFWDPATEQEGSSVLPARETMTPPYVVARSADDRLLAAGAEDGSIQIWDRSQREKQTRLFVSDQARLYAQIAEWFRAMRTSSNPEYAKDTEGVTALAFSPDGRWLATAGKRGSLRVWETDGWKERWYRRSDAGASPWLVFTPDSSAVVGGCGGQVCVWDTRTGETRTTFGAKTDAPVLCGVFVPERDVLAIGAKDGTIRLWNLQRGELKHLPAGHQDRVTSLAFTPDGKTLASASWDRTVRLWSMRAGREVAALEGHKGRVNAVAFSPDGKILASGGESGEVLGEVLLWRR